MARDYLEQGNSHAGQSGGGKCKERPVEPTSGLHPSQHARKPEKPKREDQMVRLTFFVVGKRHNTRFYATAANTWINKDGEENGNVKPGFIVDHTITHPYSNDFYLQSHKPVKGTGRSAHYFPLVNQMKLSSNDLHNIGSALLSFKAFKQTRHGKQANTTSQTHHLCYVYSRATKGVSYCAPAYYADRPCDRGQAYLRSYLMNKPDITRYTQGEFNPNETHDALEVRVRDAIRDSNYWRPHRALQKFGEDRKNPWHPNVDEVMFYL